MKDSIARDRLQSLIFIALSLVITGFVAILYADDGEIFGWLFGDLHPVPIVVGIAVLGFGLITFLRARGFTVYTPKTRRDWLVAMSPALPLGILIVLVDVAVEFPDELNVLWPQSLLYYPAMGYIAEVLFHLLPLSLLLIIASRFSKETDREKIIWRCILLVALLEPVFQTVGFVGAYPFWAVAYVGLHVFLINFWQLILFKRHGFITMYAFRLAYYLLWHIVWGQVRVDLLF